MITIIAATIAGFIAGYAMCNRATREIRADAWRWKSVDLLRRVVPNARVTLWNEDDHGRFTLSMRGKHTGNVDDEFRAATIDIAIAQALHAVDQFEAYWKEH